VFLVVMLACVLADLGQVHRAGNVVAICECSAGYTTRTGDPRQGSQIDNFWLGLHGRSLPVGLGQGRPMSRGGWGRRLVQAGHRENSCLPGFRILPAEGLFA
jgi:hypothetical protein